MSSSEARGTLPFSCFRPRQQSETCGRSRSRSVSVCESLEEAAAHYGCSRNGLRELNLIREGIIAILAKDLAKNSWWNETEWETYLLEQPRLDEPSMSSAMNEWKSTHLTYPLRQKAAIEWMMANKQKDAGRHLFRGSFRAELKQQYGHFQLAVFFLKNSMRSARASDLHEYMAADHTQPSQRHLPRQRRR